MFDIDPQTAKQVEAVARSPFSAGFLAGLIMILRGGAAMSWGMRMSTVFTCILVAGLFGPALSELARLESENMKWAFAAFISIYGLDFTKAVFDAFLMWIKTVNFSDLIPWAKSKTKDQHDE